MTTNSHPYRRSQEPQNNTNKASISVFDFLKKAKQAILLNSTISLTRIHAKVAEDPSVFVLPKANRTKIISRDRSAPIEDKSASKPKSSQPSSSKAKPKMSEKDANKLSQLLKKKHQLMVRLRKVDQELYNPSLLPVTMQNNSNSSFLQNEDHHSKEKGSRLNLKQDSAYNVDQHKCTMEMLSKISNQKMRRQEKIVSDMKRKQQAELQQLEKIENNRSKLQQSRPVRNLQLLRNINKKQTEKLQDTESASSSNYNYHSKPQKESADPFEEVSDLQTGSDKTPEGNGFTLPELTQ